MDEKILKAYIPHQTTLREVARKCGTDHHKVKRVLEKHGIIIVRGKKKFSKEHRAAISNACKGRETWSAGKRMSKQSLYKNMAAHIRFDVSFRWLEKFPDIEKLKVLNRCVTNRSGRWKDMTTDEYKHYIEKFYYDIQFNKIYQRWIESGKQKYLKPSVDHIVPKSSGGSNKIDNLQFLTWFENRCKNDMTQEAWNKMKENIGEYFV